MTDYREKRGDFLKGRDEYKSSILSVVKKLEEKSAAEKDVYTQDIFKDSEKYREDYKRMLGWPLWGYNDEKDAELTTEKLCDDGEYEVFRTFFKLDIGVVAYGLLYKKKDGKKRPMVFVQHGGAGSPELISGFYTGDTSNYNDMLQRVIKYDVNAFCLQTLNWSSGDSENDYGSLTDRIEIDSRLKRVGSSITAIEVYVYKKMMDCFEKQDYVKNFGMVGLSYGGFYTIFVMAADTRIKAGISCSWFNERRKRAWSDWSFQDAEKMFGDAEVAALIYPRRIWIEMGDSDPLFDKGNTKTEFDRIKKAADKAGVSMDWAELVIFEGDHEFCKDDAPIEDIMKYLI